ncbi:MAG TPA: phosphoenolpyruvate synthase, partial [Candidatus Aenigmarchaeota archaeon]|nr:phosphoenolpyruvate synthase [Candidatus Aenigmarchaeota archaeon]
IRDRICRARIPKDLENEIIENYRKLGRMLGTQNPYVAVRSSATAEDLPGASFAGQQETYLNVEGEKNLIEKVKRCMASLFTDRSISYRVDKGFDHFKVGISVGIQKMGRSDIGSSGVMFTIDPDSGFEKVIVINGSYGLGEYVVQGKVTPDSFVVFEPTMCILEKTLGDKRVKLVRGRKGNIEKKVSEEDMKKFCLTDEQVLELAKYGMMIEKYYKVPMDIEWVLDGETGEIYIVQARPETVHSLEKKNVITEYAIKEKGKILLTGTAIGRKIGIGRVNILRSAKEIHKFNPGEVLVTDMTDPDWEPIMKMASAIVTNKGGTTCFAGDTLVLTDKGFMRMEEAYQSVIDGETLFILSYDYRSGQPKWKRVVSAGKRDSKVIRISVSQTGRMNDNYIHLTPDHKMYTYEKRNLIKKRISDILRDRECICLIERLPAGYELSNEKLAYLLGAILTDGYIQVKRTKGRVIFTQRETDEKKDFINTVRGYFREIFSEDKRPQIKYSHSCINGRMIVGEATDFVCTKMKPALVFTNIIQNLVPWIANLDEKSCLSFIAGVIDGDGSFYNNRINIYISKENLLQGVVVACLKLGIVPQVTRNRCIYNVQIVERTEDILLYTKRVKGTVRKKVLGTKLFAAKQILSDIIDDVNYKGRIKPYVRGNLLLDSRKIERYVLPLISNPEKREELKRVLGSCLRMHRVLKIKELGENEVFNLEVEAENEMDRNYVVFTRRYTPLLVSNSHAAIVSRELGVPCIIGTKNATEVLKNGQEITVDCSTGVGRIFEGYVKFEVIKRDVTKIPKTKTKVMVNIGEPNKAFSLSRLPVAGVGLAREEFIITSRIGVHPLHLVNNGEEEKYINALASGIGKIAAAFYPRPVIVRLSDFKSDEYANLKCGEYYEPKEANPMIGWRGASRYYDKIFSIAFELECRALQKVREDMGLKNVIIMVPFCRTPEEG